MNFTKILTLLLPNKFIPKPKVQKQDFCFSPADCFMKDRRQGPFLRSFDGRIIPLRKARFLLNR